MKALIIPSILLSALLFTPTANAATRSNCRLVNEGGCVKLQSNSWMEFCPSEGEERIDGADKNDRDCVSVKPFQFSEFNSQTNEVFVVKQSYDMDFETVGSYTRHYFTNDCSDVTMPCAVNPSSIEAVKFTVAMNTTSTVQILIDLFIFSEGGVLSFDGQQYSVEPGSFKFDMRSEGYSYINSGCDGIMMDVQMKTLGGAVGDHAVNNTGGIINVDNVMRSPMRYTHGSSPQWASVNTIQDTRGGSDVISFVLNNLPNNQPFHFDPFVAVPAASFGNGAAPSNFKAAAAFGAIVAALAGLVAL